MTTKKVLAIQLQVNAQQAQAALNASTANVRAFAAGVQRLSQQTVSSGASVLKVLTSWQSALFAVVTTLSGLRLGAALVREAKSLDEFSEKMRQLKLNAQELSTLEFVADRINVPFDTLAESVSRANIALEQLRRKGRTGILGVNLSDANGARDVLSVLQDLGPAMNRMGMGTYQQQAVLADVFGKQALNLDRLMSAGMLTRYREELDKLGGPTAQRNIDAGVKVADALDDMAFAWKRVKQEGVVALAELTPAVEWLAQRLGQLPGSVQGFTAALGAATASGPNAAMAQQDLAYFGMTIVDGMRDSAMALAVAAGRSIGATFEAAVASMGPTVGDMLYEAAAPLLRKFPGLDETNVPLTLTEQVQRARIQARPLSVTRQWEEEGMLRQEIVAVENPEAVRQLAALEKQLSTQRQERINAFFQGMGTAASVTAQAFKDAGVVIDESFNRIERVAGGLRRLYGEPADGSAASLAGPSSSQRFSQLMNDRQMLGVFGVMNSIGFVGGGSMGGGEPDTRAAAFARERRGVLAELDARRSIAFGGEANAARTRTQIAFEQQRQELFEKYGESARGLIPALEQVQSIEQRRMSLDGKVTAALRELNKAQEQYNLSVAQRAQRVTAGLMTPDEARRADDMSAQALLASQQTAAEELRRLQQEYPEFARLVDDTTRDVRQSIEQLSLSLERISRGDWRAGFRAGLEDIRLQAEDVFTFTRDLTVGVANSMASGFSTAFTNIVNGTASVKDAFRDLASSVLNYIAQMTMQMLVFRAIAGIAGAFAGGTAGASGASLGGAGSGATASGMSLPTASRGLNVFRMPGLLNANGNAFNRGSLIPFAQGGVVTRPTTFGMSGGRMGLMGEAGPEAIVPLARSRRGKLGVELVGGGSTITIAPVVNVTVTGGASEQSGQRIGREVVAQIVDVMQRDPDLRRAVRGM